LPEQGPPLGAGEAEAIRAHRVPLGITRNLRPRAPEADFQARWNWDRSFATRDEAEEAIVRYQKLRRFALQAAAVAAVSSNDRLRKCLRVSLGGQVGLVHSPGRKSAYYRGLATCGSVWACPVCAAKVSERRREELKRGVDKWRSMGGIVWMVTLTFSHQVHDSLPVLQRQLAAALRRFQSGKYYGALKAEFGFWGHVRALEVTHGANGWHPHVHMLVFLEGADTNARREELRERLFHLWRLACKRSGLGEPSEKHGVRVDGHNRAGEYVAKWGLESELTKQVVKEGRGASRSPMGILADWLDGGDLEDAALFEQYACAMKGARQLVWSRGLRELLGLGAELSDEELAAADERQFEDVDLASIPLPVWRLVVKYDVRGQLLVVASGGDQAAVTEFLELLEEMEVSTCGV